MRIPLLLFLIISSPGLAGGPTLHDLTERLLESEKGVTWNLVAVTDSTLPDVPDDCKLMLGRGDLPIAAAFSGVPSAVRVATIAAGPFEPSGFAGRDTLSAAHKSLAAVTLASPEVLKAWMKDSGRKLMAGERVEALTAGELLFSATSSDDGNGKTTLYFGVMWPDEQAKPPEPGLPTMERSFEKSPAWKDNVPRVYRHNSGTIVLFDEDHLGRRAVVEYLPSDKVQAELANAVWLLISGLGAADGKAGENQELIAGWLESPTLTLRLHGATVQARDGEDGKLVLTVREAN